MAKAPTAPSNAQPPKAAAAKPGAAAHKAKPAKAAGAVGDVRQREMRGEWAGLVLLGAGVAFGCALVSHDARDMGLVAAGQGADRVANWLGPVGARMADMLLHFLGLGAFLLDGVVLTLAIVTLAGKMRSPKPRVAIGLFGASLSLLVLLHLVAQKLQWRPMGKDAAGLIPGGVAVVLKALLSTTGTTLLAVFGLLASAAALTNRTVTSSLVRWIGGRAAPVVSHAATATSDAAQRGLAQWRERSVAQAESTADDGVSSSEAWTSWVAEATTPEPHAALAPSPLAAPTAAAGAAAAAVQPVRAAEPVLAYPFAPPTPVAAPQAAPVVAPPAAAAVVATAQPATVVARATQPLPRELTAQHMGAAEEAAKPAAAAGMVTQPVPATVWAEATASESGQRRGDAEDVAMQPAEVAATSSTMRMNRAELDQTLTDLRSLDGDDLPELASAFVMPVVDDRTTDAQKAQPLVAETVLPLHAEAEERDGHGPRIVQTEALRSPPPAAPLEAVQQPLAIEGKTWVLPPSTLLAEPPARGLQLDDEAHRILRENAVTLESKLAEFGILGEVSDIRPGPVVTTYEYRPAAGVKISKIVNLRDDLTMKLAALRVRVVAPIPGRDVVGIEVPNKERQIVYFREVLERTEVRDNKGPLPLILGKDIEGKPMVLDLAKAPHLLVAGSTGTGKSVGINSFICSLLFRCSPSDVKFILIDPKILELSIYADIPHLLLPVLDEPRKAELALKWACTEMDRRYRMMAEVNVRNLASYKQKIPELRAAAQRQRTLAGAHAGDVPMPEDPPYIVVIIDEFADLIMSAGKEVEVPVARLAQKARAAGIHVVLATQRPSTDVITGMIKANFPTRVSFQVASAIDSKVVLNANGAETLLGRGDMLLVPPGEGNLKRCHGTWISDDEVAAVAKHWRDQGSPVYELDILKDPEAEAAAAADDGEADPLYDDAVQCVVEANQASVSFLQRKLGIGYGRAARMIDVMAARGIVGPSRGPNKPREILVGAH